MAKALVIVDMLNDFVQENGALPVPDAYKLVDNINAIKKIAYQNGIWVVYATDAHDQDDKEFENWPVHAVKDTYGAQVIDELQPKEGDIVIEKQDLYMFTNPDADRLLRQKGIDELIVTGVATEYCVRGVALTDLDKYGNKVEGAIDRGYKVNLVVDGIAGVDEIVLPDNTIVPGTRGAVARALVELGNAGVQPKYTTQVLEEMVKKR